MDGRPGPVRDAIAEQMRLWGGHLADLASDAMARGELLERTDPLQLAFELDALGIAVNSGWQLHEDDVVAARKEQRREDRAPPRDPAPARSGRHRARPRRARRAGRLIGPGTHEGPA